MPMNKIISSLGAVLMALLLTFGLIAPPASAHITAGGRLTSSSGAVKVDNWIVFQTQADGSGVKISDVFIGVAAGCGSHFVQSPKWWLTDVAIYNGNTGAYVSGYTEGNGSTCDRSISKERFGPDTGFIKVIVHSAAQHPSTDLWYIWEWHLYPSGNSVLANMQVVNY